MTLDGLLLLIPLQLVAFGGLLGAFTSAHHLRMHFSGYPSIDMHCIMLPVKFDGGLFISVLRNKQLFKNKGGQKFGGQILSFQTPPLKKVQTVPLEKVYLFQVSFFL
jgi:hypothetical protein